MDHSHDHHPEDEDPVLARVIRIETKLSKLLRHIGLDPVTGDAYVDQLERERRNVFSGSSSRR